MRRRVCALTAKRKLRGGRQAGKGATLNRRQLEAAGFICASEITLGAKPHGHRQQRSIYEPGNLCISPNEVAGVCFSSKEAP